MGVLGEVLRAHMWADRPRQTCGCGWDADSRWMTDREQPNRVEQHLAHVEAALLARLADVLGSDETREVVIKGTCAYDPRREEPHHTCTLAADAALAAVREALGLPGGGA